MYPAPLKSLLLSIWLGLLVLPAPAWASGDHGEAESAPTVSRWTYQQLNEINGLLAEEAYAEARKRLQKMLPSVEDSDYETALVQLTLAFVHAVQENYPRAIQAYEQALGHELPKDKALRARYDLAQLYLAENQAARAVPHLEYWLEHVDEPTAQAYLLLGNAYTQLKRYRDALPRVEEAVARADEPRESWYQLLLALHLELDDYAGARPVLEAMIRAFPDKPAYWQQLTAISLKLRDFARALAVSRAAYERGFVEHESDLLRLVHLYLHQDLPHQAARLLKHELAAGNVAGSLANWRLLADAWLQARETEKAVDALRQATRVEQNSELAYRLARLQIELENWDGAIAALERTLENADFAQRGDARLLLGIARHKLGRNAQAAEAFNAARSDPKVRQQANDWLSYLDSAARPGE